MRRLAKPTLLRILAIVILLPLLFFGILLVVAGSESGTRLLADRARALSGGTVDWEGLEGSLLGALSVEGLRVEVPAADVSIDQVRLEWSPGALLRGRLDIDELAARELKLVLKSTPATEEEGAAFDPEALQAPLDITLRQLRIESAEIQTAQGSSQIIDRLVAAVSVEGERVTLSRLQVDAPEGGLEASGSASLAAKLPLELQAHWHWQLPDQRELGGRLLVAGDADVLRVEHAGEGQLPANLEGELRTLLDTPAWTIALDWPALPLDASAEPLIVGPGSLHSSGSLEGFSLGGEGQVQGLSPETLDWSLNVEEGSLQGMQVDSLRLASGPGAIDIRGRIDWSDDVVAELSYTAVVEGLAEIQAELPQRLDAEGRLNARYRGDTARVEVFELALAQSPLRIALQGDVLLRADAAPELSGRVQWWDLAWPLATADSGPVAPDFTSPEGSLTLTGTPEDYQLTLSASTGGSQAPPVTWQAEGQGDLSGMRLAPLRARLLDGEVRLQGDFTWSPVLRWTVQAEGENLDPGQWQADLPGKLALALHSSGELDPETGPQGEFSLDFLRGTLSGQAFELTANAGIAGEEMSLHGLRLRSGENHLEARGGLSPEKLALEWSLDAPAPHTLIPDTAGHLQGAGSIGGTIDAPRLQASISADNLAYGFQSLELLRADIQAGLAQNEALEITLQLENLLDGEATVLQSAQLSGSGTSGQHTIAINVATPTEQVSGQVVGGLDSVAMAWAGQIDALRIASEGYGEWKMPDPAAMQISAEQQSLAETCLASNTDDARICIGGGYSAVGSGHIALQVHQLGLARFAEAVGGELNGSVEGQLAPDGALSGGGKLSLSPGELRVATEDGSTALVHRGGELKLELQPDTGLHGDFRLAGESKDLLQAQVTLPRLGRLPLVEPQLLDGSIRADIDDLSGLPALVPGLSYAAGRLFVDLQVAGTMREPQLRGELALADGAADVSTAGLELREIFLSIEGDPERPGYLFLSGGAASGPGNVALDGQLRLRDQQFDLAIKGEKLEVWDTPDGRALLSPDLRLGWDGELAKVRGRVEIPRADITPKLAISPGMATEEEVADTPEVQIVATSADVVILGPDGQPIEEAVAKLPFLLDSRIEVAMGDKVRVNALGFKGRITGSAVFINTPQGRELIPIADGRFSVEEGTFRAFGQDLEIETGQVIFARVPATEPEIALRAVRWIDSDPTVSVAGVQVTGPFDQPLMELFSRPQVDSAEIQSFLLTGRAADSEDSVLSIGTYVHPKLYVGYGYNMIAETSEFDALYTITPRYGFEVTAGEADNRVNLTFTHER